MEMDALEKTQTCNKQTYTATRFNKPQQSIVPGMVRHKYLLLNMSTIISKWKLRSGRQTITQS